MSRARVWSRSAPEALFIGSAVGEPSCVVVTGAAAIANVGAVVLVALFTPGVLAARIAVMPA